MKRLSNLLNLKESQVYKWNWDRRQMQDKYLMKRLEGGDIPDNLFRVTKVDKSNRDEDLSAETQNGYFKVLRSGNFKKII